ncbi:MAG: hypothetical protein U5Q44_15355 [Dehalococcoidia bacterium]|nr:hypothetical protein [Dehalococcoidia bacterium]
MYPPLGLYAAAAFDTLTPFSLTAAFQVLPWAGTVFAAWACWRLSQAVLRDEWAALAATLAFVLVPRSFAWLLMGGGLPRAWALGFALLAIAEAYRLAFDERDASFPRWQRVGVLGALAGLTALTHLETAAFLALSCAVLLALRPKRIVEYVPAAVIATAVAAPWGITVLARHGLAPFESSLDHGGRAVSGGELSIDWIVDVLRDPVATGEPFLPLIGALGFAGAFFAVARGQWFLPLWWLVTYAVAMRAYPTFVSVPAAILAGMLIVQAGWPVIRERWIAGGLRPRATVGHRRGWRLRVCVHGCGGAQLGASGAPAGAGRGRARGDGVGCCQHERGCPLRDRAARTMVQRPGIGVVPGDRGPGKHRHAAGL